MNEQFIILAEKLNNVTSIAESLTPEVIQQTLGYHVTLFYFLTVASVLLTSTLFYLAHREGKKTLNSDPEGFIFFGIISAVFFIVMSFNTIEITYYPYSWLYTHFLD